ncbi:MAG TPA: signal peptidase I [Anaerolineales bacterium]|nr:signal peptidase I [Anaerolineales bacterium]
MESAPDNKIETPASTAAEWRRVVLDLFETVVLALVLFLIINTVSARVRVDGQSMLPTLNNGEFVLVNRMSYKLGQPARGDIIVFRSTTQLDMDLIKRIIGVPGDQIHIADGQVKVNDVILTEPYISAEPRYSGEWSVPDGYLFVLGDNRNDSSDSHAWGLLPEQNVIGKAILIYWPPPDWAMINHVNIAVAAP